ncbi:Putative membrane protein [Hyphomicrobiales bacterium]|nr:Putative membrane protein [Hyphomicrobiales bacterium]CAH1693984.1 putative membrane protein [Hyphomicrobiales bacterium]
MPYLLALLVGIIAGLRAMTAPAAIAWAAYLGWLNLSATPLAFMGYTWTPWIFTVLALVELVADQLPSTPSRTVPVQFGTRIVVGALCGACLGAAAGNLAIGAICGAVGAVVGTLGGRSVRGGLAASFGKDPPAALIEDAVAIIGAFLIVMVL